MTRAGIESIEKQDIRRRYAGKQAPRANRKKLTAATVMDGKGLMKLESEQHNDGNFEVTGGNDNTVWRGEIGS